MAEEDEEDAVPVMLTRRERKRKLRQGEFVPGTPHRPPSRRRRRLPHTPPAPWVPGAPPAASRDVWTATSLCVCVAPPWRRCLSEAGGSNPNHAADDARIHGYTVTSCYGGCAGAA